MPVRFFQLWNVIEEGVVDTANTHSLLGDHRPFADAVTFLNNAGILEDEHVARLEFLHTVRNSLLDHDFAKQRDFSEIEVYVKHAAEIAGLFQIQNSSNTDSRKLWTNDSYNTAISFVCGKIWLERDVKSDNLKWFLFETGRTADYIALQNQVRGQSWRILEKRMDYLVGTHWEWISNGMWSTSIPAVNQLAKPR